MGSSLLPRVQGAVPQLESLVALRCVPVPAPAAARVCALPPGLWEGSQRLQTAASVGFSPLIAMETVIKLHGGPWQCAVTPWPGWGLGGDQAECPQAGTFLSCWRCRLLPASPG